jgi:uncharacterized protein YciI
MPVFVVELTLTDDPARLAARPAHRQRLAQLHADGVLVMSGPFADDSGALLIFDIDDPDELDRILAEDPYYSAPGVRIVRRQPWSPILR